MRALVALLAACGNGADPARDDAGTPPVDDAPVDMAFDAPPDGPRTLNGCTEAMAVDLTDPGADRTIAIADDFYTPKCPRISAGQSVTWVGEFQSHPLSAGLIMPPNIVPQPGNPIPTVTDGTSQSVTFPDAGEWAFYCPSHPPGMAGVVYVVP